MFYTRWLGDSQLSLWTLLSGQQPLWLNRKHLKKWVNRLKLTVFSTDEWFGNIEFIFYVVFILVVLKDIQVDTFIDFCKECKRFILSYSFSIDLELVTDVNKAKEC